MPRLRPLTIKAKEQQEIEALRQKEFSERLEKYAAEKGYLWEELAYITDLPNLRIIYHWNFHKKYPHFFILRIHALNPKKFPLHLFVNAKNLKLRAAEIKNIHKAQQKAKAKL